MIDAFIPIRQGGDRRSDLLPAAREVAEQLGKRLTRERLVAALRERGLTVGSERKAAIYAFVRAERKRVAA